MAISYVGGKTAIVAGSSSVSTTVSLTDIAGGSGGSPLENDIVVVGFIVGGTSDVDVAITAGYTELADIYSDDTRDANLAVFWKRMGSTPDTSFDLGPSTNAAFAGAAAVQVFRGVDTTTAIDVTSTTATGIDTDLADPASITPATSGAWVVAVGGGGSATGVAFTSSDLTNFLSDTSPDNNDATIGMGYIGPWTSGAVDPAVFGAGSNQVADSWASVTLALRPASGSGLSATASGSIDFTGAATATVALAASSSGSIAFTGSATATVAVKATASGSIDFTGTGTATVATAGGASASGSIAFTGSATATVRIAATGSGTISFGGSAAATVRITASASGSIAFTGSGVFGETVVAVPARQAPKTIPETYNRQDWPRLVKQVVEGIGKRTAALESATTYTGLGDYADDTASAAGGVAVGSLYRTGSVIKVRLV